MMLWWIIFVYLLIGLGVGVIFYRSVITDADTSDKYAALVEGQRVRETVFWSMIVLIWPIFLAGFWLRGLR